MRMGKENGMNTTGHNEGETRFQKLGRVLASSPGLAKSAEVAMSNMTKHSCSEADFRTFLLSYMRHARNRVHARVASRLMQEFLPEVSSETLETLLMVENAMYSLLLDYDGIERVNARAQSLHKRGKIGAEKFPFLKHTKKLPEKA